MGGRAFPRITRGWYRQSGRACMIGCSCYLASAPQCCKLARGPAITIPLGASGLAVCRAVYLLPSTPAHGECSPAPCCPSRMIHGKACARERRPRQPPGSPHSRVSRASEIACPLPRCSFCISAEQLHLGISLGALPGQAGVQQQLQCRVESTPLE